MPEFDAMKEADYLRQLANRALKDDYDAFDRRECEREMCREWSNLSVENRNKVAEVFPKSNLILDNNHNVIGLEFDGKTSNVVNIKMKDTGHSIAISACQFHAGTIDLLDYELETKK